MDFNIALNNCIEIFTNTEATDPCCLKRYATVVSLLKEMQEAVESGSYPRDYAVLPLFHYIDRNMDSSAMYEAVRELDEWYAESYRTKSEAVVMRERIRNYLLSDGGLSERRADASITKLARHEDIYREFAEYVPERKFPANGVRVSGYNAETLYNDYPLSPLGAYNYLIFLREMPEQALADLAAGLPSKDTAKIE